ncbi:MAG: UDP-N-acetylmuramate--alanine ligase [Niastella sp. SCN 39-18]|nr:MAG: UDP-N-acetylmuramate--alanine ligase [Niastella sp. SCN 39-18]OJW11151.1 MAG: UDP-N-acetylmuramate--alanine ligase [Sphingobacteriales bacterium 39-19]
MMIKSVNDFEHVFFIGIAGAGMSALAQYLKGINKEVCGSDRFFIAGEPNDTRDKLEAAGIRCFEQDGQGITEKTQLVVASAAIEDTVAEIQKAKALHIPVLKRSELLAFIADSKKTIAIGGTSGKSTTAAMLYHILEYAGFEPSIITGAGLTSIIKEGKIGNAAVGKGEWLVIEADESDGSIVQYHPHIGILLNIDKDHQEIKELVEIFLKFKQNTKEHFIVNRSHALSASLSARVENDFSIDVPAGLQGNNFRQQGLDISFTINEVPFTMHSMGRHNMENALAACAAARLLNIPLATCAGALKTYEGIYRRHQVLGKKNGIWVIDDYAHNPAKCAASIKACQHVAEKVVAWFQPHGYAPTRFLRHDFVKEIADALRPQDEIWMSEIFYAGGTTIKDISANDLIQDIKKTGKQAFFVENRNNFLASVRPHLAAGNVLLLMGARDPSLEQFSEQIWQQL